MCVCLLVIMVAMTDGLCWACGYRDRTETECHPQAGGRAFCAASVIF